MKKGKILHIPEFVCKLFRTYLNFYHFKNQYFINTIILCTFRQYLLLLYLIYL